MRGRWPANFFGACQREQESGDLGGGIFTTCLIDGLKGDAWDKAYDVQHIDVRQMRAFLDKNVPARIEKEIFTIAKRSPNSVRKLVQQSPTFWTDEPPIGDRRSADWQSLQLTAAPPPTSGN
jgi:hypothetical protein